MGDALIGRLVLTIGVRRPSGAIVGGHLYRGIAPVKADGTKAPKQSRKPPKRAVWQLAGEKDDESFGCLQKITYLCKLKLTITD